MYLRDPHRSLISWAAIGPTCQLSWPAQQLSSARRKAAREPALDVAGDAGAAKQLGAARALAGLLLEHLGHDLAQRCTACTGKRRWICGEHLVGQLGCLKGWTGAPVLLAGCKKLVDDASDRPDVALVTAHAVLPYLWTGVERASCAD